MRLIDADALRRRMYHEAFETNTDLQRWDSGCWIRYKMFENAIENAPTIEPERKKGKWKAKEEREKQEIFICSECGGWAYSPWIGSRKSPKPNRCKYAFCPNCGADMRGEE